MNYFARWFHVPRILSIHSTRGYRFKRGHESSQLDTCFRIRGCLSLFIRNINLYMKYQLDIENNLNNFGDSSMHSLFYDTHWIIISNAIRFKIDASIVGCNCDRTMDRKLFFFFLRKKLRSLWYVIVEKLTRTIPFKNVKPCSTQTGSETPGIYFTLRGDYGMW